MNTRAHQYSCAQPIKVVKQNVKIQMNDSSPTPPPKKKMRLEIMNDEPQPPTRIVSSLRRASFTRRRTSVQVQPSRNEKTPTEASKVDEGLDLEEHTLRDIVPKDTILKLLESEFTCCICEEILVEATVTRCSHMFCTYCLKQSKKRCKTCPLCRAQRMSEHPAKSVDEYITKMVKLISEDLYVKRLELIEERNKGKADVRVRRGHRSVRHSVSS